MTYHCKLAIHLATQTFDTFLQLQADLLNGTMQADDMAALDTLKTSTAHRHSPLDGSLIETEEVTPRKRLAGFPHEFCSDATATLGIICVMAQIPREKIFEVTATPTTPNPSINFHKWLRIDGISLDLTIGQFMRPDEKTGFAILATHPLEKEQGYSVAEKQFIVPTPVVTFAEHIAIKYVFDPDAVEIKMQK